MPKREMSDEVFTGKTLLLFDRQTTPDEYEDVLKQIFLENFDLDGTKPPLHEFPYSPAYNVGIAPVPPQAISIRRYGDRGLIGFAPESYLRLPAHIVGPSTAHPNITISTDEPLQRIGARDAAATGRGIKVAILDSGVFPHPDLKHRIKGQATFVGTSRITLAHGTLVAGIICGPRTFANGSPGYGIAPEVEIYDGQIMADTNVVADDVLRQAIDWADHDVGANIIVCAASRKTRTLETNPVFEHLGYELLESGRLLITAAGRGSGGAGHSPVEHPGNCQSIIAVGAVDRYLMAMSTTTGLVAGGDIVNFVAPGDALPSALFNAYGHAGYGFLSGTSAATAVAAGIASLWAHAQSVTGLDLWAELLAAVEVLPNMPFHILGSGLLKAPPPSP